MIRALWLLLFCCVSVQAATILDPVHHQLSVTLKPEQGTLRITDQLTLPEPRQTLTMRLHTGLEPRFSSPKGKVESTRIKRNKLADYYRLSLPAGAKTLTIEYGGRIHHRLNATGTDRARGFQSSAGLIDDRGIYLSGGSAWYPQLDSFDYQRYQLQVTLPEGWSSISQGKQQTLDAGPQQHREQWTMELPQEEIYLIAARFKHYQQQVSLQNGPVLAQAMLRKPDQKLADKYLDATARYLKMYEKLIGPYAYSKFALVENFWETGFGMPSFTLLGSRVIRLPFILNSSYPHEILHNWWGNGVFVDYDSGNWCEGLTVYLADHLIKQQRGQDIGYRQQALQKYRDYAAQQRDFPLREFRGRHSSATEAVGYGKTMMLFHMLRQRLGDQTFIEALRAFYQQQQLRIATFDDLQHAFEQQSGQDLERFFSQWTERTGAPLLQLLEPTVEAENGAYRLSFSLQQTQAGEAYELDVPIAISLQDQAQAEQQVLRMTDKQQRFSLLLNQPPTRIDIDPRFDLFRILDRAETPPAFTELFGAAQLLVLLPSQETAALKPAWQQFAEAMTHMGPEQVTIRWDDEIDSLPADQPVAVLGWNNRFADQLRNELETHPLSISSQHLQAGPSRLPREQHAFALVTRLNDPKDPSIQTPRALIGADLAEALPGLARKLPHYHKYSYLGFAGSEPENQMKGRWPVQASPMTAMLQTGAVRARLETQAALIEPESEFNAERMMQTVRWLSDPQRQGRGWSGDGLQQSADYIASAFKAAGLKPGGDDGSYFQPFQAPNADGEQQGLVNVIGIIPGTHSERGKQNLVIGAHYDHLGLGWPDVREANEGKVHPGADDNASGVAVMLELAQTLGRGWRPDRTVVFAAFSAEEAGRFGSKHYAKQQADPANNTIAMLNLDSVGRLFDNKLMVLGSNTAYEWPHIFRGIGFVTGIPTLMVAEPLDSSDQISFHEIGVPAVQLFSGAHLDYHRPTDSADKISAEGLVKVAEVSKQVVEYLATREEMLRSQLAGAKQDPVKGPRRKVSLGTIPDFGYQGKGYRLDGVIEGSPVAQAGLQKQDIIIAIDDEAISGLRDLSNILKRLKPGQSIRLTYLRDGAEHQAQAELTGK